MLWWSLFCAHRPRKCNINTNIEATLEFVCQPAFFSSPHTTTFRFLMVFIPLTNPTFSHFQILCHSWCFSLTKTHFIVFVITAIFIYCAFMKRQCDTENEKIDFSYQHTPIMSSKGQVFCCHFVSHSHKCTCEWIWSSFLIARVHVHILPGDLRPSQCYVNGSENMPAL